METNIQIFTSENFGEIRTCQVNNQIMFVGKDVATALGYAKPQNALATHVDREDKSTAPIQGTAYETRVTLINESGLYSLILSSKLPHTSLSFGADGYDRCTFVLPSEQRHEFARLLKQEIARVRAFMNENYQI